MDPDENENKAQESRPSDAPLPESVVRALAEARATAASAGARRAQPGTKSARWLAAIPLSAAALTMLLLMPRATPPEDIPLPQIDGKALEAVRRDDGDRAASARMTRLSGDVLAVGSALRALNKAQVSNASAEDIGLAHTALDHAFEVAVGANREAAVESLRTLRAVQLEGFLAEAERFEATGKSTEELELLAGPFLDHMALAGWVDHGKIVLDEGARRTAYKLVWNTLVGADRLKELKLTLDENRVLYAFYLTHPHAADGPRLAYANMRRLSTTEVDCNRAISQEKFDMEQWRIEKIRRLGEIDPTYPTGYALGVAYYREARYDQSMDAFRQWITKHPDGPLSLRARNHMMAAIAAFGPT